MVSYIREERKFVMNVNNMSRRAFCAGSLAFAGCGLVRRVLPLSDDGCYSVALLGDTHYDAEPESVYHSHYDESNKWAKIQHEEFRRNGYGEFALRTLVDKVNQCGADSVYVEKELVQTEEASAFFRKMFFAPCEEDERFLTAKIDSFHTCCH